jgi:hypothetical protein
VHAVPGAGLHVPIWILGSSLYGAQVAATFGLPYAFASHFAPEALMQALDVYRRYFTPSEQLDAPYVMVGVNVFAASTDDEARYLQSSAQQSLLSLRRGHPIRLPPPSRALRRPADGRRARAPRQCARLLGGRSAGDRSAWINGLHSPDRSGRNHGVLADLRPCRSPALLCYCCRGHGARRARSGVIHAAPLAQQRPSRLSQSLQLRKAAAAGAGGGELGARPVAGSREPNQNL